MKTLTIALLIFATLAPGCLQLHPPRQDCPDPAPTSLAPNARFDGQQLRILDQGAFPAFSSLEPIFENLTGADVVQIDGGDAGKALQQALLGAGNPPADILYGVDNALFFTKGILDACLYLPYESPALERINETLISLDVFRVDGRLWATPVDSAYVAINYDVALQGRDPSPPAALRDLASTTWAPRFVTEDPRESSPGLGFLLATIATFGESGEYTWRDYWRELLRNGGAVVPDWSTAYVYHYSGGYGAQDATNKADRSIVVSYTTSPAVEVYFGAPSPPGVSLEPPRGVFHQVETMGILRGARNPDLARAWIDFCLSDEFQRRTAPELATYPVVDGIELPQAFNDHATDPAELRPADISPDDLRRDLGRWLDEWEDLYRASQS